VLGAMRRVSYGTRGTTISFMCPVTSCVPVCIYRLVRCRRTVDSISVVIRSDSEATYIIRSEVPPGHARACPFAHRFESQIDNKSNIKE
jgi:hypothetical protein